VASLETLSFRQSFADDVCLSCGSYQKARDLDGKALVISLIKLNETG